MTQPIRLEIPTDFYVGPVNSYLFTEPEPILVDAGVPTENGWQALVAGLAAHNIAVADLQRVIISHPHIDHLGLAPQIARMSQAQIWIADLGVAWLLRPQEMWQARIDYYRDHFLRPTGVSLEMAQLFLAYMEGVAQSSEPIPPGRVVTFQVGDTLSMGGVAWQVLHMPGHTERQTCFYQPETRQFLAADMLLPRAPTPIVERPPAGGDRVPALPKFIQSLAVVERLDIDIVYPGHGQPFHNHRELIRRQRDRIQMRKAECLQLIKEGHQVAADLTNIMYASTPPQFRLTGLWMVIGYLDLLLAEGAIVREEVDGVWHFR